MAIIRSGNFLGQMRVDVPHLRSIESAVANDFDILAGQIFSGTQPLVVKGLTISTANTVGTAADGLLLNTAGSLIMHFSASESGTLFTVSDSAGAEILNSTNIKVSGSFSSNAVNYVGLDLVRSADAATVDTVAFLNASDGQSEINQIVPLARTLQFKIIISTQNFSAASNILPIAKITTSSSNTVVSIQDARRMAFRLGRGGDNPLATSTYQWASRTENAITYSGGSDPFSGEDKSITNLKSWIDAIMTSIWEVKGGEHWYSATNRDNVKVLYGPIAVLTDNWIFAANTLKWESLKLAFENADNGGVYFNTIADNTGGVSFNTDGMCLYVDLQRESNATNIPAVVGMLQTLGSPTIPGRRIVLAWRQNGQVFTRDRPYEVNRNFAVATDTTFGMVELIRASAVVGTPKVMAQSGGVITATGGTNNTAIQATGDGTGLGLYGIGGATAAAGVKGESGATSGTGILGNGTANNAIGITGNGNGTGAGGTFNGGASSGSGIIANAIGGNGDGGDFVGFGVGKGVLANGGSSGGDGVVGTAIGGNGRGLLGIGFGTGEGVLGFGSSVGGSNGIRGTAQGGGGHGVVGQGFGSGNGVFGTGGGSGGAGSYGVGATGTTGTGVIGNGGDSGGIGGNFSSGSAGVGSIALQGTSAGAGTAIKGINTAGTGWAGEFRGNTTSGPINLLPKTADPSSPSDGDIWFNSTTNKLKFKIGGTVYTVTAT